MDVLSVAREALATGPLCDNCLGRLFADRSFGLGNADRGRSLRVGVALADDEPFESADPAACWVCEGECTRFDWWAEQATSGARGYDFSGYQVGTKMPPLLAENDRLLREDVGLDPEAGELLKSEFNREVGKRIGETTGAEVDFERPDVLFLCDLATDEVDVQVNSAFVYGRYRKLEREIPQTEWPCSDCHGTGLWQGEPCEVCDGTGYRYEESVEQLVCPPIEDAMEGIDTAFHGAGREDVDARMVGTGRPFVAEVDEPRIRRVDTDALEDEVNAFAEGAVEVEGLELATHEMVERVKELDASKTYRMTVRFAEPVDPERFEAALNALDGATIEQRTPDRVTHRRAEKTRVRAVYDISGALVGTDGDDSDADVIERVDTDTGDHPEGDADVIEGADTDTGDHPEGNADVIEGGARRATLEVHGEGGLYVKELVSSDGGRTEPSLAGELGVASEVTALDVLAVEGESEPFEDSEFLL
jgi:tRNA pseudouridine synthase 10